MRKKYGRLTIIAKHPDRDRYRRVQYLCICDCGKETIAAGTELRTGRKKSCGCNRYPKKLTHPKKDLSGLTFGYLTILEFLYFKRGKKSRTRNEYYLCKCECGTQKAVAKTHLLSGSTKSCGKCGLGRLTIDVEIIKKGKTC